MSEEQQGRSSANVTRTEASTLHNVVSIVAAYVGHNSLRVADLPDFIAAVHASIRQLSDKPPAAVEAAPETPAVPIKRSVTRDHIYCLEDGKRFKSLRRHLTSFHNLTPDAYRAKWGLPGDYPMVAPAYSETRSQLAKDSGLGQISRADGAPAARDEAPAAAHEDEVPRKGRGRPRRTT